MPGLLVKDKFSYEDILNAYLDCRRRKRGKLSSIKYEVDFERNLMDLLDEVNSGNYVVGRSRVFTIVKPKAREIWAAQFRDRIIHHLIYNEVGKYFEDRFIEDTFSCIKGRGTLAAAQRLQTFCRRATHNWSKPAWYLQVDIKNFFVSIDHNILWDIIKSYIGDTSLTSKLIKQIIFHDPTVNPIVKGNSDFSKVPPHKSLWLAPKNKGLAIGNLTSQFMSNIFLDGADKYAKHVLKVKWYVRYVDDVVFLSTDKEKLFIWAEAYGKWLFENRSLCLHPDKITIAPVWQGINFVGTIIKPFRNYIRRSTVANTNIALKALQANPMDNKAFASVQSYLGMLRHTNSYNLRKFVCSSARLPLFIGHDTTSEKLVKLY